MLWREGEELTWQAYSGNQDETGMPETTRLRDV